MEVICTDGRFDPSTIVLLKSLGAAWPTQDKMYGIRDVINHIMADGSMKQGVLLDEIKNPTIDIQHAILGDIGREPTFSIKRFAHLDGSPITKKEVDEFNEISKVTDISIDIHGNDEEY